MLDGLGRGRKERAERHIVCACLCGFHREVAVSVTADADLGFWSEHLPRLTRIAVALAKMDALSAESFGKPDIVIDNERNIARSADREQWLCQCCRRMLIDIFYPKLKRRNWPGFKSGGQPSRKIAADVERRDQIQLAGWIAVVAKARSKFRVERERVFVNFSHLRVMPAGGQSGNRACVNVADCLAQRRVEFCITHLNTQIFKQRTAEASDDAAIFGEFGAGF